jgi:glycosyltransferase involved in cell wall biosynthesis
MNRLALVMIVRNEARCLARCLDSVRGCVDRMIVMDTGSTDRTVEIATDFGADVYQMEWPDDFAAARNAALAKSDADWNLVLDADEWLESGAEALGAATLPLLGPRRGAAFLGCLQVMDAGEGNNARRSYIPRVLPRGVRYEGAIHEQPVTDLPLVQLPVLVLHDGYEAPQLERKQGRNERLLRAELSARPDDPYLHYQLGRQSLVAGANGEGADSLLAAYRLSSSRTPFRHSIIIYLITALRWAGRFEEALALVDAEQDDWDHSPDFYFAVAELYLEWAGRNPEVAMDELLPVVEAAWLKCLQIGENPELDGSIAGSGSFRAAGNLANFYRILGHEEEADRFEQMAATMKRAAEASAASMRG